MTDTIVVGAGLAGLAAAQQLQAAGRDVLVLEASDAVGGRVRTDAIDGYLIDRGFQLFNPAYPEAQRVLDLEALELKPFLRGLIVAVKDEHLRLVDPREKPSWFANTVFAPTGGTASKLRFARYAYACARGNPPDDEIDMPAEVGLLSAGIELTFINRVLRPFLSGVFGESKLRTSKRYMDQVLRSFVNGTPSVPALGMQAIPEQFARGLTIEFGAHVDAVTPGKIQRNGEALKSDSIIVATDPVTAAKLLKSIALPRMNALSTYWYATDDVITDGEPILVVDGQHRGPVVNTVSMTNAARNYSITGKGLVAASTLGEAAESEVRRHLAVLHRTNTDAWELVSTSHIPHALPFHPVGQSLRQPVALGSGVFVAGDHRDTPSIQGALVSGRRAAEAVLARSVG